MDDQVLDRLHKAIIQYENGEVPKTFVQECFRFFHREIIEAELMKDGDPDTQSDSNTMTLATSLETLNLLLKMVLILYDQYILVADLGSAAGSILAISTNANSSSVMRSTRTGTYVTMGALRVSDTSSLHIQKSMLAHFQSFGAELGVLTRNIALNRNINLKTCTYDLFEQPAPRYPVVLKIDSIERVRSLILFWVSCLDSIIIKSSSFSCGTFHTAFLDTLLVIVENSVSTGLNLAVMSKIIKCFNWQFSYRRHNLDITLKMINGTMTWLDNVLQDFRESTEYDRDDYRISFSRFFEALSKLHCSILAEGGNQFTSILRITYKVVKKHVVLTRNVLLASPRVIWRQIISSLVCTLLPVIESCISHCAEASPTISFLMSCIIDAQTHHVVTRCCKRLIQRVETNTSEKYMRNFFTVDTGNNSKGKGSNENLNKHKRRRQRVNAASLEARLGLNDSDDSDVSDYSDGRDTSRQVNPNLGSGRINQGDEMSGNLHILRDICPDDEFLSSVELEFKQHTLIMEDKHTEIVNSSAEEKWRSIMLCELSFHYGLRMLHVYKSVVHSIIHDWNLKSSPLDPMNLGDLCLKQGFMICLATLDRSLLCGYCAGGVLDVMRKFSSNIARTICASLRTSSGDDQYSLTTSTLNFALPHRDEDSSGTSVDQDCLMSRRIQHYVSREDTLNLLVPLIAMIIQDDESYSLNCISSNDKHQNEDILSDFFTSLGNSCKVLLPAALSNFVKLLFASCSKPTSLFELNVLDATVLKLLSYVSNADRDISNAHLLSLVEVIGDTCKLSTNVILSKFGCKEEILRAYSQSFKCSVHNALLTTAFDDMDVHQKLLYCQLFCAVRNSCEEFGLSQSSLQLTIYQESLQKFAIEISQKLNKIWGFYSQFLCNFYLATSVPSTTDSEKQLIAVTTLIQELRVLSSIINTLLLGDSQHECIVGTTVDEHIESMLSYKYHTHYTHRLFGSIIAISLCEAQIYTSSTTAGKDAKKMIFFVSKTLKTLVDHKIRQYREKRLRDEENVKEDALSWSIITALGIFIRCTSFLWPGKALWGVTVLIDHWAALTNIHGDYEESLEEPLFLYYRLVEELTGLGDDNTIVLHLMVVQPMQACDRLIRRVIFKHENSHRIMNLFIRQILRLHDKTQFNKAFLVPLTASFLVEKDVKRYSNLATFLNLKASDRPLLTLIGETQHFYELLVSKAVEDAMTNGQMSEMDFLNGGFSTFLQGYASAFNIPICQGDFVQSSVYQKLLLLLQWDLGSDTYLRLRAKKALRIICTLARAKSWSWEFRPQSVPKRPKQSTSTVHTSTPMIEVSSDLDENVSAELSDNFLYTITHFLAYIQSNNTSLRSSSLLLHYLRFLRCLIELISPIDLVKYFPKIIFEIDRSLNSKLASVRLIGTQIVKYLMTKLPSDFIIANYPALIMTLFPIIQDEPASSDTDDRIINKNDLSEDFVAFDSLKFDTFEPHYLALQSSTKEEWLQRPPKLFRNFLNIFFLDTIDEGDAKKAKTVAIETVVNSFNSNISTFKDAISKIPCFPDIPEFRQITQIYRNEKKKMSLSDEVRNLCKLINHESHQVKLTALQSLSTVCKENMNQLYSVVSTTAAISVGSGLTSNDSENLVSMILNQLMVVAAKASSLPSSSDIVNACARCFGEIGAIDSARLSYFLPTARNLRSGEKFNRGRSSQALTSSKSSDALGKYSKIDSGRDVPPWQYSVTSFGLSLLETLAKILPEDGTDRTRVAIQEILKVLASEDNPDDPDNLQLLLNRQSSNGSKKEDTCIPKFLQEKLEERGIFEICEPFWKTKYTIILGPSRKTFPLESQNILLEFDAWIGFVCRYLSERSAGPYKQLFLACRGLVRSQVDICRFLLSHLLFDVMLFNPSATNVASDVASPLNQANSVDADKMEISSEEKRSAIECIIEEFTYVLKNQSDDVVTMRCKQLAIQAIFESTDTIRKWYSDAKVDFAKPRVEAKHPNRREIIQKFTDRCQRWPKVIEHLKKMVAYIGMDLQAEAALRIGAYSRALRCFEMYCRESPRSLKAEGGLIEVTERPKNTDYNDDAHDGKKTGLKDNEDQESIQVPKKLRNDGANHALPFLSARNLDLLMKILTCLDDPDGLDGVHIVRQVSGFSSTYWHRILERQHREDWLGALLEYEMAQYHTTTENFIAQTSSSVGNHITSSSSSTIRANRNNAKIASYLPSNDDFTPKNEYKRDVISLEIDGDGDRYLFDAAGRLKCLIELGQLNFALDQTVGMISNLPKFEVALIPRGVEASWKLLKWDSLEDFICRYEKLETSSELSENPYSLDEGFQFSVGKLMLQMKNLNYRNFTYELKRARLDSMSGLLASMESYGRAYPQLVQLHILTEIEHGFQMLSQLRQVENNVPSSSTKISVGAKRRRYSRGNSVSTVTPSIRAKRNSTGPLDLFDDQHNSSDEATMKDCLIASLNWDSRLEMLTTSLSCRKLVMAVRRSILAIGGMTDLVAKNWLHLSDLLQKSGKFEVAQIALRNAEASGLTKKQALLQECTILAKSGDVNRALSMLEPLEIDTASLISTIDISSEDPQFLSEKDELANQILLATKWMVESRQSLGNTIEERFKAVRKLKGEWEDCLFEYGRFMEYRYHDAKSKEVEGISASKLSSSSKHMKTNTHDSPKSNDYLRDTINLYAKALRAGTKYITQSLPRMLTLWFSSTTSDGCLDKNIRNDIQGIIESIVPVSDKKATSRGVGDGSPIPAHVWFTCMPQIVSRAQHRDQYTAHTIKRILIEIIATHPTQGIWHIGGMLNSLNDVRQNIGQGIIKHALTRLRDKNKGAMFDICQKLFKSLVDLAGADTGTLRRVTYNFPQSPEITQVLVPIKSALHVCIPEVRSESTDYFLSDQMYIRSFNSTVEVAHSKAKPKIVVLETTCGKKIKFLCKQEKNGDLRKDAHMMEINGVINRLLQEDPEGRKRFIRLRTFSVICLNEECGILEWVNNTSTMRSLIKESHTYYPEAYPFKDAREFQNDVKENQDKHWFDIETMTSKYNESVLSKYRPYFHRWFLEHFRDPTDWLDARLAFTRSTSIWAAVGHVVGLGDRHTENILIDTTNGELVHVDFDCLFDKGLLLQRPEIVPFRLTPNIVDAMGVCGIEGTFRKTMEVGITLLRGNKDTLLSILEPFLRDPTVAWSRSGRAQQFETHQQSKQVLKAGSERDNADAQEALVKISRRLDGVYNIYHPKAQDIKREFYSRYHRMPARLGLGGQIDDSLPLSVQGQVQRLIEEATDEANLAQMFIGWTSWL